MSQRNAERPILYQQERLSMENAAFRLCPLVNSLLLFLQVETRRGVGRASQCSPLYGKEGAVRADEAEGFFGECHRLG